MIAALPAAGQRVAIRSDLLLLLAATALRVFQFGNPVIQIDEQFYLLVGDRMLHGALPFVDFWDRKPYGLFLLYAAIRALGGDGIIVYQLMATLSAACTALVVRRIASRIAPPVGGLIAGLVYLVYLSVNGGDGGQAPVFYNLPVALAALQIVRVLEHPHWDRRAVAHGTLAILLLGLALQLKYSVVFEGAFFGLVLLGIARHRGVGLAGLARLAIGWVALTLAPTMLMAIGYWRAGHFDAMWFANFQSILLRPPLSGSDQALRLGIIALKLAPIGAAAFAVRASPVGRLITGWVIAAIMGVLLFGTFHDHYALPLVLPLAVAGAPFYADLRRGLRVSVRSTVPFSAMIVAAGLIFVIVNTASLRRSRGDGSTARAFAARIAPHADGCLFVFRGDPILYYLTNACTVTAYNFPTLLVEKGDGKTIGVDQLGELRRTMARQPRFVMLYTPPARADNPASWAFMRRALAANYRLVEKRPVGGRTDMLFERHDAR